MASRRWTHYETVARRLALQCLLASLVLPSALLAQHRQTRRGFTISFGVGSGSARFDCDGCSPDRTSAPSGYIRIGGAVRRDLIIAGQIDAWTKEEGDATLSAGTVTATVQWYPQAEGGFYVLGGLGWGSINATIDTFGGTLSNDQNGFGYNIGTGYDIRLTRNFSLSPFASYFYASTGSGGYYASGDRLVAGVFHFGLGFTWH